MKKIILFILSITFSYNALAIEDLVDIKTVISEGVGVDPQSAAQNAAENALKNVVGSFIDTNTLLEKRTVINDGIQSQTKNISKDVKEYSQGSIKSFEIIDTKNEGGLFRLTAKIAVRNENFSAYIKKLAQGETKVDGVGMFAQISTKVSQDDNLSDILANKVISPILSGEVQNFEIEIPVLLSSFIENNRSLMQEMMGGYAVGIPLSSPLPLSSLFGHNTNNIVVFKVNTSLEKSFVENISKVLTNTSNKHQLADLPPDECSAYNENFWCFSVQASFNPKMWEYFIFKNSNVALLSELAKISPEQKVKVTVKSSSNDVLDVKTLNGKLLSQRHPILDAGILPDESSQINSNWWYLGGFYDNPLHTLRGFKVFYKSSFYIWMALDTEVLKKADKIIVSLGEYSNPNTVLSESKSQSTEDNKKIDKLDKNSNPEISKSKSHENSKNTEKLENNLKLETQKSEKSIKQLQELKAKALTSIKQKTNSNWNSLIKNADFSLLKPEAISKFKCVVIATLSPDGNVTDVALKESSGYGGFDSIAEKAIKTSSPLPIAKDDDLFDSSFKTMTFTFDRNNVEVELQ